MKIRPNYANLSATLALVVALGGGAYAASLPRNSVTSASIKNGQVRTKDLASSAVNGTKVKDGSLTAGDLAPGTLPTVPTIPAAPDLTHYVKDSDPRLTDERTPKDGSVTTDKLAPLPQAQVVTFNSCPLIQPGVNQTVPFGHAVFDTDVTFDDAADSLVIIRPGIYEIVASATWQQPGGATGDRKIWVVSNTQGPFLEDERTATSVVQQTQTATGFARLDAGETLVVQVGHTNGAPVELGGSCASLSLEWVNP